MFAIGRDGGKGMIFAAGEGMYVQALGTSQAAVGNLIRNSFYTNQLEQISFDSDILKTNMPKSMLTNLCMMELDQDTLKQHSDKVREHNWFDKLDAIKNSVT